MEPDYANIYVSDAERYDQFVAAEDWQQRLLPAIADIVPLGGAAIVEFGAGTGRLTRLLQPVARDIRAFDFSPHMLRIAHAHLSRMTPGNWSLGIADNRAMPLPSASADVAIAGWSFGHSTVWNEAGWRADVARAVGEMLRVLRPGATAIIIETLGTGSETPRPPTRTLADFFRWLEKERGFTRHWLRTDYRFASVEEAGRMLGFFFGDELAHQARRAGSGIVPECTGIWWRRV